MLDLIRNRLEVPPIPPLHWPIGSNASGFREGVIDAIRASFFAGAEQGFVLGLVSVLALEVAAICAALAFAVGFHLLGWFLRRLKAKAFCGVALVLISSTAHAQLETRNGPVHKGQAVDCDLPEEIRVRNTVGIDGAGLCVWAAMQMSAFYMYCGELLYVFEEKKKERGGGWPARVDEVMRSKAPNLRYEQYLGNDLTFIAKWIKTNRPVCVTFGYGEIYGRRTISHMVLCVAMTDQFTGIIDSNDPGNICWMATSEFGRRFTWPGRQGWAFVVVADPPPPVPRSGRLSVAPVRSEIMRALDCDARDMPRDRFFFALVTGDFLPSGSRRRYAESMLSSLPVPTGW